MLLDLIKTDSYVSYNIKLAQVLGLNSAVYCSELLNIESKATIKNKLNENGFFRVDRKYIFERTTLSVEDQLKVDANLMKINVITRDKDNPDLLKLDDNLLASIISSEDIVALNNIKERCKSTKVKGVSQSQRQIVINQLKDGIECSNYELLTALRNWVDGVYANPKGFLSKTAIKSFQNSLNEYTQGDLDLALRIVEIATIQGYKDCQWAINIYEKDNKSKKTMQKQTIQSMPRVMEQHKSSLMELTDDIF